MELYYDDKPLYKIITTNQQTKEKKDRIYNHQPKRRKNPVQINASQHTVIKTMERNTKQPT